MDKLLEALNDNWIFLASNLNTLLPLIVFYTIALSGFIIWLVKQQVTSKTGQIELYKNQINDLEKRVAASPEGSDASALMRGVIAEIEGRYELEPKVLLSEESQKAMIAFLNRNPSGTVGLIVDLRRRAADRVPFQVAEILEKCNWKCNKFFLETSEEISGSYGTKVLSFSGHLISDQTKTIITALQTAEIPHDAHKLDADDKPYGIGREATDTECILLFHALEAPPPRILDDWPHLRVQQNL